MRRLFELAAAVVLLLVGAVVGVWWWSHHLPHEVAPAAIDAQVAADHLAALQDTLKARTFEDDRIEASLGQANEMLKGEVCNPANAVALETLLQKLEFASNLDSPHVSIAPLDPEGAATPAVASTSLTNDALLKQLKAQTVFILAPAGGQEVMLGSGIIIAPNLVLTNEHVIARSLDRDIVVMSALSSEPYLGRVKALSKPVEESAGSYPDDFALIAVEGNLSAPALQLASSVAPLDRVVAAGFPTNVIIADQQFLDLKAGRSVATPAVVLSRGDVRVVENTGGQTPVISHTATISEGNSGGPLVNECGELVGINTFGMQIPGDEGMAGFAIADAAIARFLARHGAALSTGGACPAGH
jgi:S1-C subfamily serine protease